MSHLRIVPDRPNAQAGSKTGRARATKDYERLLRRLRGRRWYLDGAPIENWARTAYWHRFIEQIELGLRAAMHHGGHWGADR